MAIEMIEGFDIYNGTGVNNGVASRWTSFTITNSGGTPSLVAGRFGGQAFRRTFNAGGAAAGAASRSVTPTAGKALGVAYRSSLLNAHNTGVLSMVVGFREGATYHVAIGVGPDGAVSAYRYSSATAGTLLGSSAAGVITSNVYHYIETEVVIHDTTGRVRVLVNGTQVLNLTGVDTRNAGTAGVIDTILLGGTYNGTPVTHDHDDLYVNDTASAIGERRVETIVPTADVSVGFTPNAGTTNYTQVDELPNNIDADFVSGSAVGAVDVYELSNLSSTPATVDAVQVVAFAKKTDAATRAIALQVRSGATTSDGASIPLAVGYDKLERIILNDPATGAVWTGAAVNALRGGPKVAI